MEYILSKSAACLPNLLLILIIIGIGLLILGDKESETIMGCFLIIAGVIFYYLVSYLVLKPKCFREYKDIEHGCEQMY
jgi:hypothetical protein